MERTARLGANVKVHSRERLSVLERVRARVVRLVDAGREPLTQQKLAGNVVSLEPLMRWFKLSVEGADRLPRGPALLVSNHGLGGLDGLLLVYALFRETGIVTRGMADRLLFRSRLGRWFLSAGGTVEASSAMAIELLGRGEWVLNYPGGSREVIKRRNEAYELQWDGREGFARIALRTGVPIVPIAGIGVDEVFWEVLEHDTVERTRLGRTVTARLGSDHVPPVLVGPRRATVRYWVGHPLQFDRSDASALNPDVVFHVRQAVQQSLESLIAHGLQQRAGHARGPQLGESSRMAQFSKRALDAPLPVFDGRRYGSAAPRAKPSKPVSTKQQ